MQNLGTLYLEVWSPLFYDADGDGKAHVKVNGHPYLVSKEECINHVHKKSSKELHLVMVLDG